MEKINNMNINKLKIEDFLKDIKKGKYVIPDFQREFEWKEKDTCYLLDSVMRGYPIGAFLFLPKTSVINLSYRELDLDIKIERKREKEILYILDGQQRITAISRALLNKDKNFEYFLNLKVLINLAMFNLQKKDEDEEECYNFNIDEDDSLLFSSSKRIKDAETTLSGYKLNIKFLDNYGYEEYLNKSVSNFFNENDYQVDEDIKSNVVKQCKKIINVMNESYCFIIQELSGAETLESICRIFETINNSGMKLTVFDLLVAKSRKENINLKDSYENYINEIGTHLESSYSNKKYYEIKKESYLHLISFTNDIVIKEINPAFSKASLLSLNGDSFVELNPIVIRATVNYFNWVSSEKIHYNFIVESLKNLLIAIESHQIYKNKNSLFSQKNRDEIKRFIFQRILSVGSFNKSHIANEKKMIMNFLNNGEKIVYPDLKRITKENILESESKSKIYQAVLSILYSNIRKNLGGDLVKDISDYEEHHIIPKRTLERYNHTNREINSVANIILIPMGLNRSIKDKNPDIYLKSLLNNHNEIEIYKQHKLLSVDNDIQKNFNDYSSYLGKRADELAALLNSYLYF